MLRLLSSSFHRPLFLPNLHLSLALFLSPLPPTLSSLYLLLSPASAPLPYLVLSLCLSLPIPLPTSSGYFTQISTLADVQENVMEYLHVLSRPKVIDQEHDTVWTEAYIDSTVSGHRSPVSHMVLKPARPPPSCH